MQLQALKFTELCAVQVMWITKLIILSSNLWVLIWIYYYKNIVLWLTRNIKPSYSTVKISWRDLLFEPRMSLPHLHLFIDIFFSGRAHWSFLVPWLSPTTQNKLLKKIFFIVTKKKKNKIEEPKLQVMYYFVYLERRIIRIRGIRIRTTRVNLTMLIMVVEFKTGDTVERDLNSNLFNLH